MDYLPPENHAVSNLLAVISDPKGAQKRLDELNKAQSDLNSKIDLSRQLEESSKSAQAAAEKARDEQATLQKQNEGDLANMRQKLQARSDELEKAFNDHLQHVAMDQKAMEEVRKVHAAKELELGNKEAALNQREIAVAIREKETAGVKEEYENKLEAASRLFIR